MRRMLAYLRHRGPDQFGVYLDTAVGLGNARLSIIDPGCGQQPISNEDGSLWIVFNGEIFNYIELRSELEAGGHRFATHSDTEVLLHMFEEHGAGCLEKLNGQFAFAIWNRRQRSLFLARDRLGVRPLFYTCDSGRLIFASEIKSILAVDRSHAEIDPAVLREVFTFWAPLSPNTAFKGIVELPPGHYMEVNEGRRNLNRYWQPAFQEDWVGSKSGPVRTTESAADELGELLVDAVRIRLRADVPVGAYLSGGLDSSMIASIIRNHTNNQLDTFSIAFDDVDFDESVWQLQMAESLGTKHQVVRATHADIGRVFPEVVWHTEVPVMRTSPAPMFLLSSLVRDSHYKVVLTGEGADEFLAGYDIFKESKIRRFWAAQPESKYRSRLLQRLYPDIGTLSKSSPAMLSAFFRDDLLDVDAPDYSHALRWRNGRRICRFLSDGANDQNVHRIENLLPETFSRWSPLARAQYLEIKTFLSPYLLSSQGDRMGMAHSIEGRFPFLDCRVVEFCNRLPSRLKLRALTEKYLLKQLGRRWLAPQIWQRPKRPYRAPIHRSFFNKAPADYVQDLLSPASLRATGFFKPEMVRQLVQKINDGRAVSESDDMGLVGILSTQLLHAQFVSGFRSVPPLSDADDVKVCRRQLLDR